MTKVLAPPVGDGWHSRVWRLAAPIIVTNVTVPLVGLTDTAVMGHLDRPQYLGAVAVGALIFTFVFWGFGFLRMGTTALAAQARGRDDPDEERAVLARGLMVAAAIAAVLLVLQGPVIGLALDLIAPSPDVVDLAVIYAETRIWSAPAALSNYVVLGWLLGQMRPGAALIHQSAIYLTNIVLDLAFVLGLGLTVDGVALASVMAEYAGLLVGLCLAGRQLRRRGGRWRHTALRRLDALRRLFAVNVDLFIRTLVLLFAFGWFTAQGARFGDTILAANAILLNLLAFTTYALDGFAQAAEALVGESVGARDRAALNNAARASTIWAGAFAAAFAAAFAVLGPVAIESLTSLDTVRAVALTHLPWLVAMPVLAVWSYQLDGIFIGATETATLRNAMIVSVAVYLGATEILVPIWANHGLWLAFSIFMVARAATLGLAYPRLLRRVLAP